MKVKVLNLNSYYYSSTVHRQLQIALRNKGLDSITYVPLAKGYIPREDCRFEKESHVYVSNCYNKYDRNIFHKKHYKILKDMEKNLDLKRFDCMHAHSLFSNGFIALKLKEKYGIPYIVAVRGTDLNTFFKYLIHLRSLGLKILEQADKVVFLSVKYKDFLIQRYIPKDLRKNIDEKSLIIPNGIDEFWLNNKGNTKKLQNIKNFKLLHIGEISKRKNLTITLKALQILRNNGYEASLTAVGKVSDKSIFKKMGKLSYVNYIQPLGKEKLIEIYKQNDILVVPSITETFGLIYAEAMSQGLPVIYTEGQGFDGQFKEGEAGYHVNPFDARDIANKILQIANKYEMLSLNCINLCKKFDWESIAVDYGIIYERL